MHKKIFASSAYFCSPDPSKIPIPNFDEDDNIKKEVNVKKNKVRSKRSKSKVSDKIK